MLFMIRAVMVDAGWGRETLRLAVVIGSRLYFIGSMNASRATLMTPFKSSTACLSVSSETVHIRFRTISKIEYSEEDGDRSFSHLDRPLDPSLIYICGINK